MPSSLSFVFVVLLLTNCHFINGAPLQNPAPNALSSTNTPQSVDPLSSTASSKSKGSGTDPSASLFTTDASGLGGVMPTSSSPDGLDSKSLDVMGPTKTGDAAGSLQYGPGSPALDVGSPRSYGDDGLVSENSGSGSEIDTSNIDVSSLLVVVQKLTSILLEVTGTSDPDSSSPYGSSKSDEDLFGTDASTKGTMSSTSGPGSTDDVSGKSEGLSGQDTTFGIPSNKSPMGGQDKSLGSTNTMDTNSLMNSANTDGSPLSSLSSSADPTSLNSANTSGTPPADLQASMKQSASSPGPN